MLSERKDISCISLGMRDGKNYGRNYVSGNPDELAMMAGYLMRELLHSEDKEERKAARKMFRGVIREERRRRINWAGIFYAVVFFALIFGAHWLATILCGG